jgi:hypothetical protein
MSDERVAGIQHSMCRVGVSIGGWGPQVSEHVWQSAANAESAEAVCLPLLADWLRASCLCSAPCYGRAIEEPPDELGNL